MKDRLPLFPLETPLRTSGIVLGISDQEARVVLSEFELQMERTLLKSGTFQHLPQALSIPLGDLSAKTVTVHDDRGKLMEAYQSGRRVQFGPEDISKHSQSHDQMVERVRLSAPPDLVDPLVVAIAVKDRLVRVAAPVLDPEKNVAYWISGWPAIDELTALDAATVGITAKFTTSSLSRGGRFSFLEGIDLSEYAGPFTKGSLTTTAMGDIRDGVRVNLERPYLVVAANTEDTDQLRYRGTGLFRGEVEDKSIFVLNLRGNAKPEEIVKPFTDAAKFGDTNFGVSSRSQGPDHTQRASYEALIALATGKAINRKGTVFHDDLGIFKALSFVSPKTLDHMVELELGALIRYDEEQEGKGLENIATLEAYVDNNRNFVKAAKALVVHRNTLLYRLNKMATIITGAAASGVRHEKWIDFSEDPLVIEGIEQAIQANRLRPHLSDARRLCALDNPEDLL